MRFSHLAVFALSGLSLASPVVQQKRQESSSVESLLTDLFATVQVYTGAINATLAPLSASSSLLEKTAAIPKVGEQLNKITAAITDSTTQIRDLAPANATQPMVPAEDNQKRSTSTDLVDVSQPKEKRQLIAAGALLALIIVEIFATITAAVAILGLAGLLVFINPLTSALSLLILAVQLVLNVVLVGVIALLNSVLGALALGLSGL
ncbi:uncharacterized protein J4E88_007656 [Alternaria novae-zelandiae]|uniref:uncharacterized protein n=1 Tax=Alternaria novae-zelandiae TaxID=430562 RepID=UPI0020C206F7|nr:uncharacterized protein J4E88_007656 [Alternaria novae-zelandiae]XP_051330120.1 uncharacterized protein J4E85_001277 [Alternaria conjuncta]KAI4675623.1 hypothetical protein J4E88_007656 [Alternaria novae-zelandiae]KAI4935949.1 hypothetical protein J4E85_001277 [Alternaria conjuncta]